MKNLYLLLFAILLTELTKGQPTDYFQQQVDFRIDVTLNDKEHTISGEMEMLYTNNSPHDLDLIYLHFWGNAFKDQSSAFAKQKLRMGSTKFYFAQQNQLGYYSNLDFKVKGEKAELIFEKDNPDIAKLILPQVLKSGASTTITTPFVLKIPDSFSRLGHVGESYQMTQWYPKPAVFDQNGWHAMPYLDMGEFYSEFGSFDVSITLPENYVVGATGVLQNADERDFLIKIANETSEWFESGKFSDDLSFPPSSEKFKTIRFKADKVHDFAWFADKRFRVQKSEVRLPSGRKVDTWTMFTNEQLDLWKKSINYVDRSVLFYSQLVGEYPYPHATAVQSALSAGAGMEYPMITVIGKANSPKALDQVITHEIGHNWFYGILANNERDFPWMDEGINSFYEYRYTTQYYGDRVVEVLPKFLTNKSKTDLYETALLFQSRRRLDQAPETSSNDFSPINYGLSAYMKTGSAFMHLAAYLGMAEFDSIMRNFYEKWKFRHPQPKDLRLHFEDESGKNLSWFFEAYLGSNDRLDYSIESSRIDESANLTLTVKNRGEIAAPFPLSGLFDGRVIATQWFEPIEPGTTKEIVFPSGHYDRIVIDADHISLETFRQNNTLRTKGLFKKIEPFQFKFFGGLENPQYKTMFWLPVMAINKYDGFMPGLALYNSIIPSKRIEFAMAANYGTKSNKLAGLGNLRYNIYPKNPGIRKIEIGLDVRSFHFRQLDSLRTGADYTSTDLAYRRFSPYFRLELQPSFTTQFYQILEWRHILLNKQAAVFESLPTGAYYQGNAWQNSNINILSWELGDKRKLSPYRIRLSLEEQRYEDFFGEPQKYLKASLEYEKTFVYDEGRAMTMRVFAGKIFQGSKRKNKGYLFEEAFNLTAQGFNDYRFDNYYFGRTEPSGFYSKQISIQEGGMKVALGSPYAPGRSNDMIVAINFKSSLPKDLPLKLPLKPYFDMAWYNDARPISSDLTFKDQLWWQGGFLLEDGNGILGIYFPIISSGNVSELYDQSGRDGFFKRITFSLDLAKLNPWKLIDRFAL